MCGRYTLTKPPVDLANQLHLPDVSALVPRYNIAPTQQVPVVRVTPGGLVVDLLRWGLIPAWAKDPSIGARMINARAETVADKPSFRSAFRQRRCLVLTDGFYEWQKTAGGKVPHYIRMRDGGAFAFAGLWERWSPRDVRTRTAGSRRGGTNPTDATGGADGVGQGDAGSHAKPGGESDAAGRTSAAADTVSVESCTIITTQANELTRAVHDRMPVILSAADYACWLDTTVRDTDVLSAMLRPYPSQHMTAYAVTRRVNSVAHDEPACVEPATGGDTTGQAKRNTPRRS
ncbi:MAG: SOS response-associated peptidase [Phycisphaerae bacterium]